MIPNFTLDGILPPFSGTSPAGPAGLMSPYEVTAFDVAERFGTTENRKDILRKWLNHREALRSLGINRGFQWLDGSFLEDKEPNDLDLGFFYYKPPAAANDLAVWNDLLRKNEQLFKRDLVKKDYRLDSFFLDLGGNAELLVSGARYYLQLFSHQRTTQIWKGMLQVRMEDVQDDADALKLLSLNSAGGA
jgi:hypothetical protein